MPVSNMRVCLSQECLLPSAGRGQGLATAAQLVPQLARVTMVTTFFVAVSPGGGKLLTLSVLDV